MPRPSKKDIKAALEKMREPTTNSDAKPYLVPRVQEKKAPTRIRKKGV
jgi:hypothetical protein